MTTLILTYTIYTAVAIHAFLISYAIWRIWYGQNVVDRLLGVELVGTLTLAIIILIALLERSSLFLDVALGLAALGFISIIAFAKHITDQRLDL